MVGCERERSIPDEYVDVTHDRAYRGTKTGMNTICRRTEYFGVITPGNCAKSASLHNYHGCFSRGS